ncbi:MAG: hypothetical protein ACRD0X_06680, partial [Thermoanaerobaculia bacterium]
AAPPARAVALATDAAGRSALLAAEVYRLPALLARLAGRLAGNPWLAGGRIEGETWVANVSWQGETWLVRRDPKPTADDPTATRGPFPGSERVAEAVIGCAALARPIGPFPAGLYRLARRGEALQLESGVVGPLEALTTLPAAGPAVLAAAGGGDRFDSLAILPSQQSELPDAVVFHRGGGRRWSLPGETLYDWVGRDAEGAQRGPWELVASSRASRQAAEPLLPYLDRLVTRVAGDGLRLGLWVDLPIARRGLGPLAQQLARLPIAEARTLAAAAAALEALTGWQSLGLAIVERPEPAVLVRLTP